jgi:hypothetical protein
MHSGGASWSLSKHRQGGRGKHKGPVSRAVKFRQAQALNASTAEHAAEVAARRELQDLQPIEKWLADRGHDHGGRRGGAR